EDARRMRWIGVRWIEDAGVVVAAIEGREVLPRDRAPVDLSRGSVGPSLDAREESLDPRTIAMNREARRADVVLGPAAVRLEDGHEVFCVGEDVDVRLAGVVVLRQALVGLARD